MEIKILRTSSIHVLSKASLYQNMAVEIKYSVFIKKNLVLVGFLGDGFLRIFSISFLLFLAPTVGSNPAKPIF